MAYDANRAQVVLFGGGGTDFLSDIWTWAGRWAVPLQASGTLRPRFGPPGTVIVIHGWGYGAFEKVQLTFIDAVNGTTKLGTASTDRTGAFAVQVTIPVDATIGEPTIKAKGRGSGQVKNKTFTVT
jgi:hypothetical protein